jgi:cyclic beta-1,2-glucan glucanotransferase
MRLVSDVDWTELVERVSLLDDLLQSGSDFASMDFLTRNLYRSAIEGLARGSKLSELEITRATLTAAADPKHKACREDNGVDSRERDPGYYLIGGGRPTFERTVGFRAPMRRWLVRCSTKIGIAGYIGSVIIVAAIALLLPLITLGEPRISGWSLGLLTLLGLIPS